MTRIRKLSAPLLDQPTNELRDTAGGISPFRYWTARYSLIASHRLAISVCERALCERRAAPPEKSADTAGRLINCRLIFVPRADPRLDFYRSHERGTMAVCGRP